MLIVYLKLDHTIRPMQKCGEWIFMVRHESYRVNQKNAAYRLLHAFPAMIAARWAYANDYSSNRSAKKDRSKEWLRLSAWCVCMQMDARDAFAYQSSSLPSFFFPPITPYYYLSISLSPFHEIDKLFHVPTPRWYDNWDNWKWQPTVLQRLFPPTTLYLQSYTVSHQSRP